MKRILLALWPAFYLCAQLPLPTRISAVRLSRQGEAWITRLGTKELAAGLHRLKVSGLPKDLSPDALRVTARGPEGTRLGEISLQAEPAHPAHLAHQKACEEREKAREAVRRQSSLLDQQEEQAKGFRHLQVQILADRLGRLPVAPDLPLALLETSLARELEFGKARADLQAREQALAEGEAEAEGRYEKTRRPEWAPASSVVVELHLERAGVVELSVSSREQGTTRWEPHYEARLSPDRSQLQLQLSARVSQQGGQDWQGIALELVNQEGSVALSLPASAALPALDHQEDAGIRSATAGRDISAAEARGTGHLKVPGHVDLPTGTLRDLPLMHLTLRPTFGYFCQPRQQGEVFLLAYMDVPPDFPILPQAPVQLFQGRERAGQQAMEPTAPGAPLRLCFGTVPGLKAHLEQVKRGFREVSGGREWTFEEQCTIQSTLERPVEVEVWDRGVRSATGSVGVDATTGTTPPTSEPAPGLRSWRLKVEPGGSAGLTLRTRIQGPLVGRIQNTGDLNLEEK